MFTSKILLDNRPLSRRMWKVWEIRTLKILPFVGLVIFLAIDLFDLWMMQSMEHSLLDQHHASAAEYVAFHNDWYRLWVWNGSVAVLMMLANLLIYTAFEPLKKVGGCQEAFYWASVSSQAEHVRSEAVRQGRDQTHSDLMLMRSVARQDPEYAQREAQAHQRLVQR